MANPSLSSLPLNLFSLNSQEDKTFSTSPLSARPSSFPNEIKKKSDDVLNFIDKYLSIYTDNKTSKFKAEQDNKSKDINKSLNFISKNDISDNTPEDEFKENQCNNNLISPMNDFYHLLDLEGSDQFSLFERMSSINMSDEASVYSYFPNSDPKIPSQEQISQSRKKNNLLNSVDTLNWMSYIIELITFFWESHSTRSIQAKLTFIEIVKHLDCINDFVFILRVAFTPYKEGEVIPHFTLLWLFTIWCTSISAYFLRRFFIYNRIKDKHTRLFYPFIVFQQIRESGKTYPQSLIMFEKLLITHSLILRFVEDLPQILISSIYIFNFGKDIHALIIIIISSLTFIIVSLHMGMRFPLFGTVSLLVSLQPPIDFPEKHEASPITHRFALFMSIVSIFWALTAFSSLQYTSSTWKAAVLAIAILCLIGAFLLFLLWLYYNKQAHEDINTQFYYNTLN